MLDIDIGSRAAGLLGGGHDVEREGGLAGGLGAVDLDDAAAGHAADAEGQVQRQRAGGDRLDIERDIVAQAHDGALAVVALEAGDDGIEGLFLFLRGAFYGGDRKVLLFIGFCSSHFLSSLFHRMNGLSHRSCPIVRTARIFLGHYPPKKSLPCAAREDTAPDAGTAAAHDWERGPVIPADLNQDLRAGRRVSEEERAGVT